MIRIEGGKELSRKLKSLDDDIRRKVGRAATRDAAKVVRNETELSAPPRATPPHHIADSIKSGPVKKEETRFSWVYVVRVSRNAFYWWFVEFGTSKMAPQPFFRPAFDRSHREALQKMIDTLQRRLRKVK